MAFWCRNQRSRNPLIKTRPYKRKQINLAEDETELIEGDDFENTIQFLKNKVVATSTDRDDIFSGMLRTRTYRLNWIKASKDEITVSNILTRFPKFRDFPFLVI